MKKKPDQFAKKLIYALSKLEVILSHPYPSLHNNDVQITRDSEREKDTASSVQRMVERSRYAAGQGGGATARGPVGDGGRI